MDKIYCKGFKKGKDGFCINYLGSRTIKESCGNREMCKTGGSRKNGYTKKLNGGNE